MKRFFWLLLAVALPRVAVFFVNENLGGDAIARTWLAHRWLAAPHLITSFDGGAKQFGPLHIYLLAGAEFIWPSLLHAGRVVSLVAGVLTAWPLFFFTRRRFGENAATLAVLGLTGWGLHVQCSTTSASEALNLLWVMSAVAAFDLAAENPRAGWWAALFLNLACATRYDSWLLVPLLVVAQGARTRRVWPSFAFGAAASVFAVSWLIGNFVARGDPLFPIKFIDQFHRDWWPSEAAIWYIPKDFKPGNFVAVAIGDERSSLILRRAFSIYQVNDRGVYGGTVDIVVSPHGPGTDYIANLKRNDPINLVGPLGKPFSLPKDPVPCVLVGGGYGAAPLFTLAEALTARGCRVDFILGASTQEKLFGMLEARRISTTLSVTTDDGTSGVMGRVTDVLPDVIKKSGAAVIYACGPMQMLKAVSEVATLHGIVSQTSVEESMACGIGVCMTCVMPIIGDDGVTRMLRSCVDGPAFRGDKVRWDEVGTIPADTWGAPEVGGH